MSDSRNTTTATTSSSGIGCIGIAFFISLVLAVLKLGGILDLTWLLVAMPLLVTAGIVIALLVLLLVTALVVTLAGGKKVRR